MRATGDPGSDELVIRVCWPAEEIAGWLDELVEAFDDIAVSGPNGCEPDGTAMPPDFVGQARLVWQHLGPFSPRPT